MPISDDRELNRKPVYPGGKRRRTLPSPSRLFSPNIRRSLILGNRFQRGQATLEILIALLILIPLIFGGIELSRGVAVRSALDTGLGVMVQAVSVDPSPGNWSWAAGVVQHSVDQNVFGEAGLDPSVTIEAFDSSGSPISDPRDSFQNLPYGAGFCLIGSVGYTALIPLIPSLPKITIKVEHCGVIQNLGQP
jgi:hypothetical protein